MTNQWRPVHGPRPISALVPGVTRTAFARGSHGTAQILEAWSGIVGPAIAEVTQPKTLAQGTLTIVCSGPVAMELQHLSAQLAQRVNVHLGGQSVRRLRFLQGLLSRPAAAPSKPRPSAATGAAVEKALAGLPEGPLRTALAGLGRAVLTESASRLVKQPHTKY